MTVLSDGTVTAAAEVEESMSGEDTDSEKEVALDPGKRVSARRQAQNDIFNAFVKAKAAKITSEDVKEVNRKAQNAEDEVLSIRDLVAQDRVHNIIDKAREYQTELCERAKKQNIIAVLDTGSGKTLIAVLLLQHILEQEVAHRENGGRPRVAFFLVKMYYPPSLSSLTPAGQLCHAGLSAI